jgi:hypothetical protein
LNLINEEHPTSHFSGWLTAPADFSRWPGREEDDTMTSEIDIRSETNDDVGAIEVWGQVLKYKQAFDRVIL